MLTFFGAEAVQDAFLDWKIGACYVGKDDWNN
jgi:hypothetical protein